MAPSRPHRVRVRVSGELGPAIAAQFADLGVARQADGTTLIAGEVVDETAVHGLLARIRDLGLSILEVETVAMPPAAVDPTKSPTHRGPS
jgi:hypothetical protein